MLPSYKYRLYPNRAQTAALDGMLHAFRDLHNAALQQRIEAYRRGGVPLWYADQAGELRAVRDADGRPAGFSYSAEQQVLRRLDRAFVTETGRQMETISQTDPATAKRLRDKRYRDRHGERVKARHRRAFGQ